MKGCSFTGLESHCCLQVSAVSGADEKLLRFVELLAASMQEYQVACHASV